MLNLEFIYFLMPISQRGYLGIKKVYFFYLPQPCALPSSFPSSHLYCIPSTGIVSLCISSFCSLIEFITGQFASPKSIIPLFPSSPLPLLPVCLS